jgi:hypothetical protein
VSEEDGSGASSSYEAICNHGNSRTLPVFGIDGPNDGWVAKFVLDEGLDVCGAGTVRRADQVGSDSGGLHDGIGTVLKFAAQSIGGEGVHVGVSPGVVGEFMAFRDDAAKDLGILLGVCADDEEGGFDVSLLQHVEQAGGV